MKKEYELTEEEFQAIVKASQPVPYMVFGGVEPSSPRENANRAWQKIGEARGFNFETVAPSTKGKKFFTAVELTTKE